LTGNGLFFSLKYGSTVCEKCPPGVEAGFTPKRWRFGLSIELEPPGRDISRDAVNNNMTVWVHIDEKDPDLVRAIPSHAQKALIPSYRSS